MKTKNTPIKQAFFNKMASEFDTHVRQSIPLYGAFISELQANIRKHFYEATILDVCGSTGLFGKTLFDNGFKGSYINVDGSPKMISLAKQISPQMKYPRLFNNLGGFMSSWTDESGQQINQIDTKVITFDIALELLGFQFFTKTREPEILELKASVEDTGVCIFCEKFSNKDTELWQRNENLKDDLWKSKYFTQDEIAKKKQNVLVDMGEYCYDIKEFEGLLQKHFKHVTGIYHAGNFAAYACSDIAVTELFESDISLIHNIYNSK